FTHEDILAIRDMKKSLYYISIKTDFLTSSQLSASLFTSTDDMEIATSPYGNNKQGFKLLLMSQINASLISMINYQYSETDFDGKFWGSSRKDTLNGIDMSVIWKENKSMSYWGKIKFVENDSTDQFNLYSFEKLVFELGISYQF
ncbi:MAG: hypothetical protein GY829_04795, partial [Gammaproteobacteria bacterium]|nr:hypothetical protein [Gammaproteobacteria bacterium]